jgi:hypothetical protein
MVCNVFIRGQVAVVFTPGSLSLMMVIGTILMAFLLFVNSGACLKNSPFA